MVFAAIALTFPFFSYFLPFVFLFSFFDVFSCTEILSSFNKHWTHLSHTEFKGASFIHIRHSVGRPIELMPLKCSKPIVCVCVSIPNYWHYLDTTYVYSYLYPYVKKL